MDLNQIAFQNPATNVYLHDPSIVRLDSGEFLVSLNYHGPGSPRSVEDEECLTSLYRSSDQGNSWSFLTYVNYCFAANLFVHGGSVYLLGMDRRFGSICIRRSDDGGNTWSRLAPEGSDPARIVGSAEEALRTQSQRICAGRLFQGGPGEDPPNYHSTSMPVLESGGRIYRAFEDCAPKDWPGIHADSSIRRMQAFVISAPADADLLDPASWRMSNKLPYDAAYSSNWEVPPVKPGWLEGNVVESTAGSLWNIIRVNTAPVVDMAAVIRIHEEGRRISFDPAKDFIDLPGGMTKFVIRRDPETGLYCMLCNNNTDPRFPNQRNVLSLCASEDLIRWTLCKTLIEDDSGLPWEESIGQVAFQYPDWQFDGDDIIYVLRTAYGGAADYHDANRVTFHRLSNFRDFLPL